jgi:hypothetical protein
MRRGLHAAIAALTMCACSASPSVGTDAGPSMRDAGQAIVDAAALDAGRSDPDAGTREPDAGPPDPDECEELLGAPAEDRAVLEIFDLFDAAPGVPLALRIDGCVLFEGETTRGGAFGQGFSPGERTVTITVDGVDLPVEHLSADADEVFWLALENEVVPRVYRSEGSIIPSDNSRWTVHVMNMAGGPIAIERGLDAAASAYAPLVAALPRGETFHGDVPIFAETGLPVRITPAGADPIFEDNLGFVMSCDPGGWEAGIVMFVLVDDTFPRHYVVYPRDPCD